MTKEKELEKIVQSVMLIPRDKPQANVHSRSHESIVQSAGFSQSGCLIFHCQRTQVSCSIHSFARASKDYLLCFIPYADIQNYLSLCIAASNRKTYSSSESRFLDFCTFHNPLKSSHIQTDEETLIQYVAYLASERVIYLLLTVSI